LGKLSKYGIGITSAVLLILFFWWLKKDPTAQFAESIPGADNRGESEKPFSRLQQQALI